MDVKVKLHQLSIAVKVCLLISLFSASCAHQNESAVPADIISKDTMILILTDIHLLESSLNLRIFEDRKLMNARNAIKPKIYRDYGVTKAQFYKSYDYYANKPLLIDSIYTDVISEISKQQAKQVKKDAAN